jgi:hypothetical protein
MGSVRDFLRGVGILSSAGTTVSNAGNEIGGFAPYNPRENMLAATSAGEARRIAG